MRHAHCLAALFTLLPVAALAQAQPAFYDASEGTLTYTVIHKLHEVQGTSKAVEGKVAASPAGLIRVQVRAKVASFDSGNSNRDVHMREVTREALNPYVSLKGSMEGVTLPLAAPVEKPLVAVLELNGEKQQLTIPVQLAPEPGGGVRAKFKFSFSLEGFKIERPSLLLVKVDDQATLQGELKFAPAAPR